MPPVKSVSIHVQRFGSGQTNDSEPDRNMVQPAKRPREKRGNKRDNLVSDKIRKFTKLQFHRKVTGELKTPRTQQHEPSANRTKAAVSHRGEASGKAVNVS